MKRRLPCCEDNKQVPKNHWECGYCECFFKKPQLLDLHSYAVHAQELTSKLKLDCCEINRKKRNGTDRFSCHHCECTFRKKAERDQHVNFIHKCSTCQDFILDDDVWAIHNATHKQEAQLEQLQDQQRCQMNDDFVLHVKANKEHGSPDFKPDFDYIFSSYEGEDLLQLVKTFKDEFFGTFNGDFEEFGFDYADLIYFVENGALSLQDLANFQNWLPRYEDDTSMLEYLLDKDYEIEPEWVAKVIGNDQLMARIKDKHTFTFDEIYGARSDYPFENNDDVFYVQVHRHFPNPNFEDPFADPYEDFKCLNTEHVNDHLNSRYFYDRENDELSIVIGYGERRREISLGRCAEMSKESLEVLITEYKEAVKIYDELNDRVSDLFDKREKELDDASTRNERENISDDYYYQIYRDALPDRNNRANIVSKLYFVISMK